MKKFVNLKIFKVEKLNSIKDFYSIINLIKTENKYSILSKLSKTLIIEYLKIAFSSKNLFLFVLKYNKKNIGYSIFAKNEINLIKDFEPIKFKIFIELLLRLKFFSLINIVLAMTKLDLILLNKKYLNKKNILNLNLLAINKNFQSRGFGSYFLSQSTKIIHKNFYKFKYITCEAPNLRALNFYTKKKHFRFVGKKIRLPKNFYVLIKKFN